MTKPFKPLLAAPVDFAHLTYDDLWISEKIDGVRAIVINGVVMSRSLKPIPNEHVQRSFAHLEHYDGELILGDPTAPSCYRDTVSAVMSREGAPAVTFHVFDHVGRPHSEYINRYDAIEIAPSATNLVKVRQIPVRDEAQLLSIEAELVSQGHEGVMLRKARGINSLYKFGRSTAKACTLLKLKRMASAEAEIIDIIELERNLNEAVTNELGYTERSTHKENKVAGGVMGALRVRCLETGVDFNIGTGFDAGDRVDFWENRDRLIGRVVTYNHFPIGRKDLPRHPSYKGFRDARDMS